MSRNIFVAVWRITVGGGYGSFEYVGSERDAEEMRRHKAEWEGAVARKEHLRDADAEQCARYVRSGPFNANRQEVAQ